MIVQYIFTGTRIRTRKGNQPPRMIHYTWLFLQPESFIKWPLFVMYCNTAFIKFEDSWRQGLVVILIIFIILVREWEWLIEFNTRIVRYFCELVLYRKWLFIWEHKKNVPKSTLLRVACMYEINVMKIVPFYTPKINTQIVIHIQMAFNHFSWENDLLYSKLIYFMVSIK